MSHGINGIDHVAIAVADLEAAIQVFASVLGTRVKHREDVGEFKVTIATLDTGGTDIELIQATSADSPVAKFVAERGAGIHHIALRVPDIDAALVTLRSQGVPLIDETARPGKDGSRVAFIHPKATGRVLCELVQPRR
jgi:methylmalonyl-CoA/ethylmalonyl-CoA epimerase